MCTTNETQFVYFNLWTKYNVQNQTPIGWYIDHCSNKIILISILFVLALAHISKLAIDQFKKLEGCPLLLHYLNDLVLGFFAFHNNCARSCLKVLLNKLKEMKGLTFIYSPLRT
jgi:hypothetical protein